MVEFRPGASSEAEAREREAINRKEEGRSQTDRALETLARVLKSRSSNTYSETFAINPDGQFDDHRPDGNHRLLLEAGTPNELYQLAHEIEKAHPEYHFNFETDPEGKWLKYTVMNREDKKL